MKKALLFACICACALVTSCNNNAEKGGSHTHEDGSTHDDHDTTKPSQQEFRLSDTTKNDTSAHTHSDGEKHSH